MSATTTTTAPVLGPAAQAFAEATADPPFLADLPPSEGRALVDQVQSGEIAKPDVDDEWITVAGGPAQRPARDPRRRCGDPQGDRVPTPDAGSALKGAVPARVPVASNTTRRLT